MQLVFFSSIFNTPCICLKIRCDGESEKFCKIFWELNKALASLRSGEVSIYSTTIWVKVEPIPCEPPVSGGLRPGQRKKQAGAGSLRPIQRPASLVGTRRRGCTQQCVARMPMGVASVRGRRKYCLEIERRAVFLHCAVLITVVKFLWWIIIIYLNYSKNFIFIGLK